MHHGDCVIADVQAHLIARALTWRIETHPPINEIKRAFCQGADFVHPSRDYIPRDHDIVDATQTLVATPAEPTERLRSGTWATIRHARKSGKTVIIINPDGSITSTLQAPPNHQFQPA